MGFRTCLIFCSGRAPFSRCLAAWLLLAVLGLGWAREAASQAPEPPPRRMRFVRWSYRDAGHLARGAGRFAPFIVLGVAPPLQTASLVDEPLLEMTQQHYTGPWKAYLKAANELGNRRMLPATAGLFALSLATDDTRFQDAAFTSFQSVLYARLITGALKGAVGRARPANSRGLHRLVPFSGNRSFPSGHATTAFAAITPWVIYYPNAATYGLFALSAGTAVARIALDRHWPTDVLAGAAIGFFVGRYLAKRHLATASSRSGESYDIAFGSLAGAPRMGMGLHAGLDLTPRDRHAPTETMHLALGPTLDTNGLGLILRVRFE